jgi:uncharacterized protein (TIGR02246 family)
MNAKTRSLADEAAMAQHVRTETLRLVQGLSQEQFDWSPAPGKWSIGEVLDHLLRAEQFFQRDLEQLAQSSPSGPTHIQHRLCDLDIGLPFIPKSLMPALELPLSLMTLLVPAPVLNILAFSRLLPLRHPSAADPRPGRPAEVLRQHLGESCSRTAELIGRFSPRDAAAMTVSHPMLGIRTIPELIRFQAHHEMRHQGQIQDLKKSRTIPEEVDEQDAIRTVYRCISQAWRNGDATELVTNFALDGDMIDAFGRVARGRKAVEALLAGNFSGMFHGSQIVFTPQRIRFLTRELAIADGTWQVTLPHSPGGQAPPPIQGLVTSVFRKIDGKWKVEADRPMMKAPLPPGPASPKVSPPEPVRQSASWTGPRDQQGHCR